MENEDTKEIQFYQDINYLINEMQTALETERKINANLKEDGEYLLSMLKSACNNGDINYVYALILSLNYYSKEAKCLKFLSKELMNIVIEYNN